jgi:IS605 OrfB family transposase
MQFTTQTKLEDIHREFFQESACYTGHLRGKLLKGLLANQEVNELKKKYIAEYGLTARQFNSLASEVQGIISSASELRKIHREEIKAKIATLTKKIKALQKKLKQTFPACGLRGQKSPRRKLRFAIHQKKRRLVRLQAKLAKLEGKLSICLGSKKLFLAQYNLEENGYPSHALWLKDWQDKRNNRIFYLGSADESFGNQNCQLVGNKLYIRVMPFLVKKYADTSKYTDTYIINNLCFSYGQEHIAHALEKNQALNFRLVSKKKGWYVHLTTEISPPKQITKKQLGAIGVDLNPSHLAWTEINHHGNLIAFANIPTPLRDCRKAQAKAILTQAVNQIVDHAKQVQKPIVVEQLDFSKKKVTLSERGVAYRRMLSYFAYSLFFLLLLARAFKQGVQVIVKNPAFSSIIGKFKFMPMFGLSIHLAASFVLARRGLSLSERIPANYAPTLAEHKAGHVWSFWKALSKAVSNRELQVGATPRRPSSKGLG